MQLIISFLASSGAIKASNTISTLDVKIGIPCLLLCIEMAIFSILHLWAYPWKPYDIKRSSIVAAENGAGYPPDPKTSYKGGKLGYKAFLDAFNPWDLVKAVGRGFRWIVVGRRKREQDISYEQHFQGTALQNPVGLAGGRTGKYERLAGEDDVERPDSFSNDELRYAHPTPYSGQTDPASYAAQGDLSTAHYGDRRQDYMDDRTIMPGRLQEDEGFQAAPPIENRRPAPQGDFERDTGYHGAVEAIAEMPDPAH